MATLPAVPREAQQETDAEATAPALPYCGPSFGASPEDRQGRRSEEKALIGEAKAGRLSDARRDKVRRAALAEIPRWYSPYVHLAATTGVGLAVLVVSGVKLFIAPQAVPLRWTDFLVVPMVALLANFFEWRVHKHVLHRRFWPFEIVYDKHTPMHHIVYVEEDMALRSVQEFRLVLIPAAGVLGIVLAATPFAIGVAYLWSVAAGWLFLLTASLFMVTYEVLHLCYHAPKDSLIGRRRTIGWLRAHHAKHHDPRLMQRYNFNVTVPFFDWVMGTMAPAAPPARPER